MTERQPDPGIRLLLPLEAVQYFNTVRDNWPGNPEFILDILLHGYGVQDALNAAKQEQELRNVNALLGEYGKFMRGLLMMNIDDLDPNVAGNYRLGLVYPNISSGEKRKKRVTLSRVILSISLEDNPQLLSPGAQIQREAYHDLQSSINERIGANQELLDYLSLFASERP